MQGNYYFAVKSGANVDVDISNLSNSDEITISCVYLPGEKYGSERVTVSTAKGWSEHLIEAQTNIGTKVTYSNGELVFKVSNTSYSVAVWVTFNN